MLTAFGPPKAIEVLKCERCLTTNSIVNPKGIFSETIKPFVLRLTKRPNEQT